MQSHPDKGIKEFTCYVKHKACKTDPKCLVVGTPGPGMKAPSSTGQPGVVNWSTQHPSTPSPSDSPTLAPTLSPSEHPTHTPSEYVLAIINVAYILTLKAFCRMFLLCAHC